MHAAICTHISPYLSEWQHGFVKGKSCGSQSVLTHHQWVTASDEGRQVDVAFLDFSKAFDRVNHSFLLHFYGSSVVSESLAPYYSGVRVT